MKNNNLRNTIFLFITAAIWGVAFVAQSVAMDYVQPFTFTGVRNIIGCLVLLPVIFILDKRRAAKGEPVCPWNNKTLIVGGIICGLLLCAASNLQQIGIQFTTVGKTGFITAFYIVLVPVFGIFLKKKCPLLTWIAVLIALGGLYLLCINESFTIGRGDILVFLCSLGFTIHILVIDHYSPLVDGVKMSCIQFFVCGVISLVIMAFTEQPVVSYIFSAWQPILYAGVLSCGVAYTLQIVGQNGVNPTVASLILSLESVISVIAGWLFLRQSMNARELIGCALMFGAIILVQLKPQKETV